MPKTKTKLTEQERDTLAWMHRVAGVPQAKLARDYEISRRTVGRIVKKQAQKSGK